jgi:hypothetical protein
MNGNIVPFPVAVAMPIGALPLEAMLSAIPSLPRPILARLTAHLIDRLDELDGDPDVEEDDHSGDPLDLYGESPSEDGSPVLPTKPIYGVDQSRGPINEHHAHRAYRRAEMGL